MDLAQGDLAQAGQSVELKEKKHMEVSEEMRCNLDHIKADVYLDRSLLRELKTREEVVSGWILIHCRGGRALSS